VPGALVAQDLEDGEGGAQGEAEDGEDAEGARDLPALAGLDDPAVVGGLGQEVREQLGQPVLGLEGAQQSVGEPCTVWWRRQ
jgi:hypothetical protein